VPLGAALAILLVIATFVLLALAQFASRRLKA
jgi:hypothetical protein